VRRWLLLGLALVALAGCGGGDDDGDGGSDSAATGTSTVSETTTNAAGECSQVEAPEPRQEGGGEKQTELPPDKKPELVVETNCGSFTIALDQKAAPKTVASVAGLAEAGFYDDTTFHRIVPGFVIQGGDPTATGTGGPGYSTVDTPAQSTTYTKGVVAMAKTPQEAPGTSGSQFFVVTGPDIGLPPDYAVIGKVTDGMAVVNKIGSLGDPATEEPSQVIVISRMRLKDA
jgi:peptidyl-prolyl cis-trans isomerase B (cyclophilin B)